MRNVYIIGSDTLKFGKYLDVSHAELTRRTVEACLADADLSKKDIESAHFGNSQWGYTHGQHAIRGQLALRKTGIDTIPVTNHEAACATGSLALHTAYKDILSGLFECSLAVGVEKILQEDKLKSFASFGMYIDSSDPVGVFKKYEDWQEETIKMNIPEIEQKDHSPFMDIYGYMARWHMDQYGTTQEQLAIAASKNHWHSTMNPKAQYQFDVSVEDVLNDYPVSWPLTRSMCAPVGDGASSAIVCSEEFLKKLPENVQKRAIKIKASVYIGGDDRPLNDAAPSITAIAGEKAYEMAGLSPNDVDVAEVHDATIIGEIIKIESMGFCPIGEGGPFTATGATRLGGKIPINTSGGLVSRGHPVAASGMAMIHELVTQLRGEAGVRQVENAKIALCENDGGMISFNSAAVAIHILEG
jgi:acetyl-CoA acetyltransferase